MSQELITVLLVFVASAYLAQRGWRRWKSGEGGSCPGCKGCSASTAPQPTPLIALEIRRKR